MKEKTNEVDLKQYSVRTDLAIEAREMLQETDPTPLRGIESKEENREGVDISWLSINDEASQRIGKKLDII